MPLLFPLPPGRRGRFTLLAILVVLLAAGRATPLRAAALVGSVDSVGITVSDLDRSVAFFENVLDFQKISETELSGESWERLQGVFPARLRVASLRLGDESIELTEYLAPKGRPVPVDSRSQDRWFQHVAIIVSDMDRAYARLREHGVEHASSGPQRLPDWNPNAGGIRAFYFRDPDGHPLEILEFPPGKGDSKWQNGDGKLFLGIDHTAIVVDETDASLGFWRDALGLRVAGESENYGAEQERLNAVFGARLRITALRAAKGPGVELLEYLAPSDGRPYPADARASDLFHWQTRLASPDLEAAWRRVREGRFVLLSPGPVPLPERELGFGAGLLLRDPDGHAVQLVAP